MKTVDLSEKELENIGLAYLKYCHKERDAKKKNLLFNLSFKEYLYMLSEAGISASQIGVTITDYCLGRIDDSGGYEYGNCRFITVRQNFDERRVSPRLQEHARTLYANGSEETKAKIRLGALKGLHNRNKHEGLVENCLICNKG